MTIGILKHVRQSGLAWQVALLLGLITLLVSGAMGLIGQQFATQTFSDQRTHLLQKRQESLFSALEHKQMQMLRLAQYLQQDQYDPQTSVDFHFSSTLAALADKLNQSWPYLSDQWQLSSLLLLADGTRLEGSWGSDIEIQHLPQDWLERASAGNQAINQIWCHGACVQLAIIPLPNSRQSQDLMLMASPITSVVAEFSNLTQVNVGLLLAKRDNPDELEWQIALSRNTATEHPSNYAEQLAQSTQATPQHKLQHYQHTSGQHFELAYIPLNMDGNHRASLVLFDDITELERARSLAQWFLLLGPLALAIIVFSLTYLVLARPMGQLRQLAKLLPSMSSERAQTLLTPATSSWLGAGNEIEQAYAATRTLAHELDDLEEIANSRTSRLRARSQELLKERNFITTLLNNVQVAILTQDADSQIKLMNSEGQRLLALTDAANVGGYFIDCITPEDQVWFEHDVERLLNGEAQEFVQEIIIHDSVQGELHTEWYHSLMPAADEQTAMILSVGVDLTARRTAEQNLAWLADHDSLTQLFNRRRFQVELIKMLNRNARGGHGGALIFVDIDQFKTVNDTSGHPMGDLLLKEFASFLQALCTEETVVARLGADEFAIAKPECDGETATAFVANLSESIREREFINHRISISAGITLFPEHGRRIEDLMAHTDLAMYKAKAASNARCSWHVYSVEAPDKAELHNRVTWQRHIEQALEQNRFLLYFQPILDIHSQSVCHFESLLRMRGPNGEIIAPGEFIPVAEQTGLIYEIDQHVVKLATAALAELHKIDPNLSLSVNLSAKAITSTEFVNVVEQNCSNRIADKSKLIFELTETSAVEDINLAAKQIERYRALGYKFALDDFGVGFSSWYYLRQLPVDFVKIDGSFVRNLGHNIEDRLFVKAINDVAQGLGKRTIAEFVEDKYALTLLSAIGVNFAQGYEIGKPVPLELILEQHQMCS